MDMPERSEWQWTGFSFSNLILLEFEQKWNELNMKNMQRVLIFCGGRAYNTFKKIEHIFMITIGCKKLLQPIAVFMRGGGGMAYKVLDVSRFIINYCNENGYEISNLKLQKLLYFIQADYLSDELGEPCFYEDIQAWNFGPVVPEVYQAFKLYGSGHIPKIDSYMEIDLENWEIVRKEYNENLIEKCDRKRISSILDELSGYSATTLVNISHHQRPWMDAYKNGQNSVIDKESIREYFTEDENQN